MERMNLARVQSRPKLQPADQYTRYYTMYSWSHDFVVQFMQVDGIVRFSPVGLGYGIYETEKMVYCMFVLV